MSAGQLQLTDDNKITWKLPHWAPACLPARPNSIPDQIWGEEEDEKTRGVQRPRKRNAKTGTNSIATERGIVIVESAIPKVES